MDNYARLSIADIGRWLEWRRPNKSQTILLLGSRAGALYRSEPFYKYCQRYVVPPFSTRSPHLSFRECYNVLVHNPLSERELYAILQDSLSNTRTLLNIADRCCAEIIKRGYFREIISTNLDDIVEQAMHTVGLIEDKDFEVCIPGKRPLSIQRDLPYRLTKVFGDVLSRQYAIYNRQAYLVGEELDSYLRSILNGDVLAVGIDPLWDRSILHFLHDVPGSLWFVNEEEHIFHDQQVHSILSQPKSAVTVDQDCDYNTFWIVLYQYLHKYDIVTETLPYDWTFPFRKYAEEDMESSLSAGASLSSAYTLTPDQKAIRIMYIYCDDDLPMMQKIWQHLQILKNKNVIIEWHRGLLTPGEHVQLRQERELRRARLIFVGVSAQFVSSEYHEQALQALKLSYEGVVTLVPLLLRPVGNSPFSAISALPRKDKTLSELSTKDLDRVLSKIAADINDLIYSLRKKTWKEEYSQLSRSEEPESIEERPDV